MDGGKLSVPFDRLNEFYDVYIQSVKSGERIYVVEQKSETYNFFVDIDYKDVEPLGIDDIREISKTICDTVNFHGAKECLISVSPPKPSGDITKTGIHLNWPEFVVDQNSAIALREHILVSLSKFNSTMDWNEIIDSSVYGDARRKTKGSGFRMPWSYKRAKHDACGGKGCASCENGRIDQLAYLPVFMYTLGSLARISPEPSVKILKMSAVRTDAPRTITVEPPSVSFRIKECSFSDDQTNNEIYDEELKNRIETFIRKNMDGQDNAYITKLFKNKETYYAATTSRYCENVKRNHSSNHVWFIISGREILQKCFSRHETIRGRRDGFCEYFCGRRHKLTNDIIDKLYPKKEVLSKCPEIKKIIEKPGIKQMEIKPDLEYFINHNMKCSDDTRIVNINHDNKNNFMVMTTSNYCETISGIHDNKTMSYSINKNKITQKCPLCKRSKARTHLLPSKITSKLSLKDT
jgi:hypothetical protein|tara:strand:- start:309 stop:1703 length:1395 start_codon:yes stop_codon:yes gene_type:complete